MHTLFFPGRCQTFLSFTWNEFMRDKYCPRDHAVDKTFSFPRVSMSRNDLDSPTNPNTRERPTSSADQDQCWRNPLWNNQSLRFRTVHDNVNIKIFLRHKIAPNLRIPEAFRTHGLRKKSNQQIWAIKLSERILKKHSSMNKIQLIRK